ncbi:AMP-binding protein, partial [Alteromonas sp. 5E99-2]|uniref:condensation domain-containing protein n=1 Tax=Alteromonas sp. 5E99-2 TaxID=2817683 RepID=UPI001A98FE05
MTDELLSELDPEMLALLWADDTDDSAIKKQHKIEGPLSFSQYRLWMLQQLDPAMIAYNMPRALLFHGQLNTDKLVYAFQQLINKHAVFRTQYHDNNGQPLQRIIENKAFTLEALPLDTSCNNAEQLLEQEQVKSWFNRPFDLTTGELLRASLISLNASESVLLIDYHHIASDAWSNGIILQDLAKAYQGETLAELDISYLDFAYWQNEYLTSDNSQANKDYWLTYLSEDIQPIALPTDHQRPDFQSFSGKNTAIVLEKNTVNQLKVFCKKHDVTPFMVLLATWQVLLSRFSNQGSFAVGVPTAARKQAELQSIVGFFVNTQIYKADLNAAYSVKALIEHIRNHTLNLLEQETLPLDWLLENINITRSTNRSPLFQVLFDYKTEETLSEQIGDIRLSPIMVETTTSKLELELSVLMGESHAKINLSYQTALFNSHTANSLLENYNYLLLQMLNQPSCAIGNLTISPVQTDQLLAIGSNETSYEQDTLVHELIEQQARSTPNAIALVFEDETLTYQVLNARANQLAHYLIAQGVQPEDTVGIAVERSVEMVVGLLAILKVGGAYVPIEPSLPKARIEYIMQSSGL